MGERLLLNQPFRPSENEYDWLGAGIYFWESNPDRALLWAEQRASRKKRLDGITVEPFVVGAVIDLGFCLDLLSANGIGVLENSYRFLKASMAALDVQMPVNSGGDDFLHRQLDCTVVNILHSARKAAGEPAFDTVRGVFMEGDRIYPTSGFRRQSHIQICVRNPQCIKGVFRVPSHQFSAWSPTGNTSIQP